MSVITVGSKTHEQVIDITEDVAGLAASMSDGICTLFIQHTTCALTALTNEERQRTIEVALALAPCGSAN